MAELRDPLKKLQQGDRFVPAARSFNASIDNTLGRKMHEHDLSVSPAIAGDASALVVRISSTLGVDLAVGSIVGLGDVLYDPATHADEYRYGKASFLGITPTASQAGKFAVLVEPITAAQAADGILARAVVAGIARVQLDVQAGQEDYTRAEVDPSHSSHLNASATGSAQILWRAGGSGLQEATVRLAPPCALNDSPIRRVELKTALTPSSDGSPTTATAHPLTDNGNDTYTVDTTPANELTVIDPTGYRRGRARDPSGDRGSYCWIAMLDDATSGKYEILDMEEIATWCKGVASSSGRFASFSVNNVEPLNGLSPVDSSGEIVTVYNNSTVVRTIQDTTVYFQWSRSRTNSGAWVVGIAPHLARGGHVILTEDMGATVPRQVAVEFYEWYSGNAPDIYNIARDPDGCFSRALSGAFGRVFYDSIQDDYILYYCEQAATRCRVSLNGALSATDTTATVDGVVGLNGQTPSVATVSNPKKLAGCDNAVGIIEFDEDDTNNWILTDVFEATECTVLLNGALTGGTTATVDNVVGANGPSPNPAPSTVYNPEKLCGADNAFGRIRRSPDGWALVSCRHVARVIAFTLTEDMGETTAGQASATINSHYDGSDPGSTTTILDPQGIYPLAESGAKGKAYHDPETGNYIAQECEQSPVATTITCRVNNASGVAYNDATFPVDNVTPIAPADAATPTVASVVNFQNLSADDDTQLIAFKVGSAWWGFLPIPWETIEPITSATYTAATRKLETKTTSALVINKGTESLPSTVVEYTTITSTMTNFQVDTTNLKLQRKNTTLTVVAKDSEDASWTDIHTGDDCSS